MKRTYLENARMGAGLTKGRLAAEAGLTRENYKAIEEGDQSTSATVLIRIGEILGMDAQEVEDHEMYWMRGKPND